MATATKFIEAVQGHESVLLRLAGQVVGPGLHQFPTAFKVICSPVGQFRSRTFDVAQGKLRLSLLAYPNIQPPNLGSWIAYRAGYQSTSIIAMN